MAADLATRINRWIVVITTALMLVELAVVLFERQWMNAMLVAAIIGLVLAPTLLRDRMPVVVPSEFQVLAIIFVFAALFLGEVRSYYVRFWWWDIVLHGASGLLLGIVGFLLVYVLNENDRIELHMRPRFVALFAFLFAVTVGALWEIFEFTMDAVFGTNMQKPMLGDPSGLTDTMWDLVVDSLGALIIGVLGGSFMKAKEHSFIEAWIRKFIERNPRLFSHSPE